jgi:hypothetical protein
VGENRKTIIDLVASWGGEYEQWANHTEVQNWRNWNKGKNDFPEIANNPNRAGCPQNINIGVIDRNTTVFTQAPELVMMHILGHNAGMDHGYYAGYGFVPYHGIMYATPSKTNYVRYYRPEKTDSQFKDILEDNKLWKHILKQRFF